MKFLKITFCLLLLLVCIFSSCSDIDNITESGQKYLNIEVEDENEKCITRVNYDGFPVTHFETDDKIGVIVSSSSSGVTENVCFTKQADGTWRTETPILYDANAKYYAYYPYDEKAPSVNIGGETVDDVFASFDNQFWFADQSKKENFDKSNLMIAEGVASDNIVKFTMKHKRAMAVFYVDGVYDFGNYVPYTMENKKYFLMKPYENYIMGDFLMAAGEGQYVTKIIEKDYMKFVALEDATFTFNKSSSANITYLAYSIDNGKTWVKETGNFTTPVVKKNTAILWKGKAQTFNQSTFSATGKFSAKGNIMSLLYGEEDFEKNKKFDNSYAFYCLFKNNNKLVDVGELRLPATTLAEDCYTSMFEGCSSLKEAPELPATTLANCCYDGMFFRCSNLQEAPKLPATTLKFGCYRNMFSGCTALTKAPELPATTLTIACYYYMFSGCTALTKAPELPATKLMAQCYREMFLNCKSLENAPELPATTLADGCYYHMFSGCTALTKAPELPATTLVNSCYTSMFEGCSSLKEAPQLPATTLVNFCYQHMFEGCKSLETAPELPATKLKQGCYYGMFSGCTALTKAPELPATTLVKECYYNMFIGCDALTKAPELPATTLVNSCYTRMFFYCTNLSSVTMLAPSDQITSTGNFSMWLDYAGTGATSRTLKVKDKAAYDALVSKGDVPAAYWQTGKCTILDAAGNAIVE